MEIKGKEVSRMIYEKITITKEEQAFLQKLLNIANDLSNEYDNTFEDAWLNDLIVDLAENGEIEF